MYRDCSDVRIDLLYLQYTILALGGAVMVSFVVFIPLLIVVSVIYCSWAVLSYHKKSTSNIEKK